MLFDSAVVSVMKCFYLALQKYTHLEHIETIWKRRFACIYEIKWHNRFGVVKTNDILVGKQNCILYTKFSMWYLYRISAV